jgi:hypothetical protein
MVWPAWRQSVPAAVLHGIPAAAIRGVGAVGGARLCAEHQSQRVRTGRNIDHSGGCFRTRDRCGWPLAQPRSVSYAAFDLLRAARRRSEFLIADS